MEPEKILVSTAALKQIIIALNGPGHYIRELQATRNPIIDPENPINILTDEYNEAIEMARKSTETASALRNCTPAAPAESSAVLVPAVHEDSAAKQESRLRYIYDYSMAALVRPVMTFDEWLSKLDIEVAKS